ncbi:MAG: hypothetical protein ABI151_14605 [Chitinophagaceae bacterium]
MNSKISASISTLEELKLHQQATRLRIKDKEQQIRLKMQEVPGELFYSGIDSVIPSFLSGKVSSFALNAGKGVINHFFVRKAVGQVMPGVLRLAKPSGLLKKISSVIRFVGKKRIK